MMRSLYSAVSGLKAHQTKMDVIGNNIANVNTVAYKSQSVTFTDVYYQTTQSASGPNTTTGTGGTNAQQIGLGSAVGSISTSITTAGASERTDNPYDLQISGDSFFIVQSAGTTYFTRAGDFTVDESGALVTSSGASVMGWQTLDDSGNIVKDKVQALYVTGSDYTYTAPEATTAVSVTGNLEADSTDPTTFTINFYDSLGNSYQASLTATYNSQSGGTTTYDLAGGSITKNGEATTLTLEASGQFEFDSVTGAALDSMSELTLTITCDDGSVAMEGIGTNLDSSSSSLDFDASGITMYSDTSKLTASYGIDGVGEGKAVGTMTSVGIDTSGGIVASYSNGDTKIIGQIAVTTFSNPSGLEKVGDNLYSATLNSGSFDGVGVDISTTGGSITSGYLEMSNVDLATEFTNMITTQRGYQANSRVITVSDSMLEELINLKRS